MDFVNDGIIMKDGNYIKKKKKAECVDVFLNLFTSFLANCF